MVFLDFLDFLVFYFNLYSDTINLLREMTKKNEGWLGVVLVFTYSCTIQLPKYLQKKRYLVFYFSLCFLDFILFMISSMKFLLCFSIETDYIC